MAAVGRRGRTGTLATTSALCAGSSRPASRPRPRRPASSPGGRSTSSSAATSCTTFPSTTVSSRRWTASSTSSGRAAESSPTRDSPGRPRRVRSSCSATRPAAWGAGPSSLVWKARVAAGDSTRFRTATCRSRGARVRPRRPAARALSSCFDARARASEGGAQGSGRGLESVGVGATGGFRRVSLSVWVVGRVCSPVHNTTRLHIHGKAAVPVLTRRAPGVGGERGTETR